MVLGLIWVVGFANPQMQDTAVYCLQLSSCTNNVLIWYLCQVDFYIDGGMIHIADTKVARRYGDYFIRQIHKFEDINRVLKALKI